MPPCPARLAAAGPSCGVHFGANFHKDRNTAPLRAADYLTVWLGSHSKKYGTNFNPHWHGRMLQQVREQNATAAYYAYIIAMLARSRRGLQDCDVGSRSLCVHGADFIRENEPLILDTYEHYANETACRLGRGARVVWLIEPDWHQYHEKSQRGGGLPQAQMVELFSRMVGRVKRHLPAARISLDISPWVTDQRAWLRPFLASCQVDFLHTSGGRTTAGSERVRSIDTNNAVTWRELHELSGRGIIADTGYGPGGGRRSADRSFDYAWFEPKNLRARIADGVVALTQVHPFPGWESRLPRLRASMPRAVHCLSQPASNNTRRTRNGRAPAPGRRRKRVKVS